MNQNYKLLISYDGTRYHGWEAKPDAEMTVEGKMETVLERMTGHPVKLTGAGRTDAGVHARGMAANMFLDVEMSEEEIRGYLNRYLLRDAVFPQFRQYSLLSLLRAEGGRGLPLHDDLQVCLRQCVPEFVRENSFWKRV